MRLGIDVGKARIGVARSDLHGMLATPVETVPRDLKSQEDLDRISVVAEEENATEIVVGLPLNMRGERTLSTDDATGFAERLAHRVAGQAISVRLVDERLSTVAAHSHMRQAGRKTKQTRDIIDQAAAVVILQHALDSERAQGVPPGFYVPGGSDEQTTDAGNGELS